MTEPMIGNAYAIHWRRSSARGWLRLALGSGVASAFYFGLATLSRDRFGVAFLFIASVLGWLAFDAYTHRSRLLQEIRELTP